MEKKQTAVEWLVESLIEMEYDLRLIPHTIERAKQLEKEQKHESVNAQVNILRDTLEEMMTGFDSEEDKMDFILDICNGYKKRINKSE